MHNCTQHMKVAQQQCVSSFECYPCCFEKLQVAFESILENQGNTMENTSFLSFDNHEIIRTQISNIRSSTSRLWENSVLHILNIIHILAFRSHKQIKNQQGKQYEGHYSLLFWYICNHSKLDHFAYLDSVYENYA